MPELPEVETVKRELEKVVIGKKIIGVTIKNSAVIREPSPQAFVKGLIGASIKSVLRKGKLLILELSTGKSLTVHLKMTGQLVYPGNGLNCRVSFQLSDGGNLYAAEALFRARINPERPASSLSEKEKEKLLQEINDTLREAIEHKGSSVDNYVQLTGLPGGYVKYHKVYGRDGKPCLVCKTVIKRSVVGGRGSYFCPKCQK